VGAAAVIGITAIGAGTAVIVASRRRRGAAGGSS
jgi:hypothetical protein